MSPVNVLAERVGFLDAAALLIDLQRAGWIIVDKDAISRAQAEAVAQYKEDRHGH